jgi:omega-6 fatty acid desaturase (delta-12 desaturase)
MQDEALLRPDARPGVPGLVAARMERRVLLASLAAFQTPSVRHSVGQLVVTAGAYVGITALMYYATLHDSAWLALLLTVPAAGFVVRLFIIQHDCGHSAYFRSQRMNDVVGWLCSLATFTPYANWRRQHAGHHAVWNNLDQRHAGADIYSACLTLREYQALSPGRRRLYRAARHPLVSQLLLPPLVFLVLYRVPFDTPRAWRRERHSVHLTNLLIGGLLAALMLTLGLGPVRLVQGPTMVLASIVGVWLFSVQHRFEDSLWARQAQWTPLGASLHGSSWLRLPRVLQWFTGNIGFHHVHHLLPRVPNYRLQACHEAAPVLAASVTSLTLREAFAAPSFALWDEALNRMVRFPENALARSS